MSTQSLKRFSLLYAKSQFKPLLISKLQTDGSFRYSNRISRTASLLREESEGEVYKSVKTYFHHQNSYESEWASVLDGIRMSQSYKIGDLQLENDNLSVIQCLVNRRRPAQGYAAKYYDDFLFAAQDMDWLEIRWIPRKLNKADDLFRIS
jgi:ribonuclease HI